jgi:hypothetical protein
MSLNRTYKRHRHLGTVVGELVELSGIHAHEYEMKRRFSQTLDRHQVDNTRRFNNSFL